ncbi:WG repeat-containing protein [Couchioplanes caeruleus]|uniref:WG repeat-containing protein n=1 Tax=Couchioplanes caeruleus TaxID=56438 RepID=UPI0031F9E6C0
MAAPAQAETAGSTSPEATTSDPDNESPVAGPAGTGDGTSSPEPDDAEAGEATTAASSVAVVERPADETPGADAEPSEPADDDGRAEPGDQPEAEVVIDVPVAVVDAGGEVVEAEVVETDAEAGVVAEPVAVEVAPAVADVPAAAEPPVDAEIIDVPAGEDAAPQEGTREQQQAGQEHGGQDNADREDAGRVEAGEEDATPGQAARDGQHEPNDGQAPQVAGVDSEPAGGGLGWLLSMSGLGAVTADPDSIPVSPAEAPVSAAPAPEPVSAAPVRTDWFSPSAENQIVTPRETKDDSAGAGAATGETETIEDRPAGNEAAAESEPADPDEPQDQREPQEQAETEDHTEPQEQSDPADQGQEAEQSEPAEGPTTAVQAATEPVQAANPDRTEQAVRAPSMQLPTLSVPPPPEPELEPVPALPDPEQLLSAYPWDVDPVTLRETVAEPDRLRALRDRLTDRVEYAERDSVRARLLSLRAVVSRLLGEYGRALADGREALRHAEATGELVQVAVVQARLAQVQQWRGDFAEADRLYEEANSVELPGRLRAEMHVNAGKSCYEQGRYLEACNHFELALELRRVEDPDLVARTEAALDAVMARVQEAGWGPYPRSREEILQQSRPPQPASDYETGLVGYADSNGDVVIAESFADAQPFSEGAAWVRRPHAAAWELIDETGALLIDESSAYLQALPFSDGLAWVSRDPAGGWFAVDWHNRVIVPGGFDDVRPFRRGVAPVRRGGWGAIDRHGRVVVHPKYRAFATELSAGGPVDGFTEEGLAVVDAGDRFGVVDRTGQLRVQPVHARLLIHPAAFLVGDRDGRWGALDRDGEPLVGVTYRDPAEVVQEIERLIPDDRPVL